ncbi:MAG: TSUP family transporter [Vicinamibacterales bacterium]
MFEILVVGVGIAAGAVASMTGFGIGSLLTPLLATRMDTGLAVAVVAIPHAIGTALRFWMLQGHVDRRVLWTFGLTSAAGGFAGAALQGPTGGRWLALVFGILLLFVAAGELTGLSRRLRFTGAAAWIAGGLSGLLGGLVGNQGGIRSAALLGFGLSRQSFVATATAIGLLVDAGRLPVYIVRQPAALAASWPLAACGAAGVIVGTIFGARALARVPDLVFHRLLAVLLALLGASMLWRAVAAP